MKVPCDTRKDWNEWKSHITLKRCFESSNFRPVKVATLHCFSDAYEEGYGHVSYLRLENVENQIPCVFMMCKSRVASLKFFKKNFNTETCK